MYKINWIARNKSFPPDFRALVAWMDLDDQVICEINNLLEINKQAEKELNTIKKNNFLNEYIRRELEKTKNLAFAYSNNYEDVFEIVYV